MPDIQVPDMVVSRLPLYLRTLRHLEAGGAQVTSSHELAGRLGLSSAQIRKDLSYFGRFGKQGTGYDVGNLRSQLERILGVDQRWAMVLVGAGALGQAVIHYAGFYERGFYIAHVFDNDPAKIGTEISGLTIRASADMPLRIRDDRIKIAVVAVPSDSAQAVADELVDAGIEAILNYAPISLTVPRQVQVEQIDPLIYLQHMVYYLNAARGD